jgi:hypothetical protein
MITIEELEERLAIRLRLADDDPEAGHGEDDDIYRDVLEAVALGDPDAAELAQMAHAFYTDREFVRWYA